MPPLPPSLSLSSSTSLQADDCDYVKPRLRRRLRRRKEGRKEGGRAREGERGSDIALPFQRQTVFYAARAITPSRAAIRPSTSEGERKDGRTRTDCCLRPTTTTALREGEETQSSFLDDVVIGGSGCMRTNERTKKINNIVTLFALCRR